MFLGRKVLGGAVVGASGEFGGVRGGSGGLRMIQSLRT